MKHRILCAVLAVMLACASGAEFAFAKRLGGGGSFGGRSTYSRSYSPGPAAPAPSPYAPSRSGSLGQGQSTPAPMPGPVPGQNRSGGMFGRMGWGMGGFLAGGLLGSMLFGHGVGATGGGGIGLLDILLLGIIAYFAVRLLRGRQAANRRGPDPRDLRPDPHDSAEQNWDALRTRRPEERPTQPTPPPEPPANDAQPGPIGAAGGTTGGFGVTPGEQQAPAQPAVPEGFSIPDFLEGAKTVYARLQHSWDRRDLNDIALFTTPEVLTEIKRQAAADPTPSKTELLLVNARMLEFREEDRDTIASVLFDVLLREDVSQSQPKQIREVWHFSRPTGDFGANWRLEGIQQLEA